MRPWIERLQRRRLKCPECGLNNANNAIRCEHCGQAIPDEVHHQQFRDFANPLRPRYLLIWTVVLILIYLIFEQQL